MGTASSAIFTGSSTYSKDFQNLITRAVSIASLPIGHLKSDETHLSDQAKALTSLDDTLQGLKDAIGGLGHALDGSTFEATVSKPAAIAATIGEGAVEGSYSILVTDAGSFSSALTSTWVAATGDTHPFKLRIGSDSFDVNAEDNSAEAVAAAINSQYGDKVHAVVVNAGPADDPDYRISLQGAKLSTDGIELLDGATGLNATSSAGSPAKYEVNGSGREVESDSRSITIANGLTLTILASNADPVDITLTRSTSALSASIDSFVTAYNKVVGALDSQRGTAGGALQGQAVVQEVARVVSSIATFSGTGSISGLKDLGIELQKDGTMEFTPLVLMAKDLQNSNGVTSFFSATSGFVSAANQAIDGLEDSTTGLVKMTATGLQAQISNLDDLIASKQTSVDDLQQRLQDQMAAADAMIASMQQQYSYLFSMFEAMQSNSQQYK